MATYIISYDLVAPGRNYQALYDRIKSFGAWAKIVESTWVVDTNLTAAKMRDDLVAVLDRNDKLFVGRVSAPAAWQNLGSVLDDWLKGRL